MLTADIVRMIVNMDPTEPPKEVKKLGSALSGSVPRTPDAAEYLIACWVIARHIAVDWDTAIEYNNAFNVGKHSAEAEWFYKANNIKT